MLSTILNICSCSIVLCDCIQISCIIACLDYVCRCWWCCLHDSVFAPCTLHYFDKIHPVLLYIYIIAVTYIIRNHNTRLFVSFGDSGWPRIAKAQLYYQITAVGTFIRIPVVVRKIVKWILCIILYDFIIIFSTWQDLNPHDSYRSGVKWVHSENCCGNFHSHHHVHHTVHLEERTRFSVSERVYVWRRPSMNC